MTRLLRRLRYLIRRRQHEADLAEEIETHRAMTQARLEASGMAHDEARYASRRTLGNVTLAREDARELWIWPSLERFWQDVRYAVRGLRQQPVFAVAAITTLALGIGATTTVFSVVEAELWKPLPFPGVRQLVDIHATLPGPKRIVDPISGPEFLEWRSQSSSFQQLAAIRNATRRVVRGREIPEYATVLAVSANFFDTLQWRPTIGRPFDPRDAQAAHEVVLSDGCWRRLYGGDAAALGQSIVLDDQHYTIVGIMAPDASLVFMSDPEIFVGIDFAAAQVMDRTRRSLSAVGRLRDGVSIEASQAELQTISARVAAGWPASEQGRGASVEDLSASSAGYNWRPLYFFLGAAVFLLVLSSVNVASLLLARALRRQREFAIRAAVGGGYPALIRQLLVEGAVLAIPGTIAGLLLAVWAVASFSAIVPNDYLLRSNFARVDARVAAFAFAICCLTTMAFGLAPALFTRVDVAPVLAADARVVAGSPSQRRLRHALVIGELTIAFVLVFGAGLFLNSFLRLSRVPLGFATDERFTMRLTLTGARYATPQAILDFSNQLRERTAAVPGVAASAIATSAPLDSGPIALFGIGGRPLPAKGEESRAIARAVSPGYFDALAIQVSRGRDFTAGDLPGAPAVTIVNETLAHKLFANSDPIGQEIVLLPGSRTPWLGPRSLQIVGVVSNIKEVGINEVAFNGIYLPFAQQPVNPLQLVVKTSVPSATLVDPVRKVILGVDRELPVVPAQTMSRRVDAAFRGDRFHLLLIGAFALVGIALASIGVYGAMAYAVQQRSGEFGLRMALGATRAGILRLALGQSVRLGVAGTAIGLGTAVALARVLGDALYLVPGSHNGLLYGVSTTDPLTLIAACLALAGAAMLAGLMPARRAMRTDPVVALRGE